MNCNLNVNSYNTTYKQIVILYFVHTKSNNLEYLYLNMHALQGGRDIGLFITQGFISTFFLFVGLKTLILICWFIKLSVQTFQPLIVIYRRGKFMYHH